MCAVRCYVALPLHCIVVQTLSSVGATVHCASYTCVCACACVCVCGTVILTHTHMHSDHSAFSFAVSRTFCQVYTGRSVRFLEFFLVIFWLKTVCSGSASKRTLYHWPISWALDDVIQRVWVGDTWAVISWGHVCTMLSWRQATAMTSAAVEVSIVSLTNKIYHSSFVVCMNLINL